MDPEDRNFVLIRIDNVCESDNKIIRSKSLSTNQIDELIIFKSEISEDTLHEITERSIVGMWMFVDVYKIRTDLKQARARPYKSNILGFLRSDEKTVRRTLPAEFNQGSHTAIVKKEKLTLNSQPVISGKGEVTVTINPKDPSYKTTVKSYQDTPPSVGDVVDASIAKNGADKAVAVGSNPRYRIQVENKYLCTGKFKVRITSETHPITGKIVNAETWVPSVGDQFDIELKKATKHISVTENQVSFDLELDTKPDMIGEVTIQITKLDDQYSGKIIQYHDKPNVGDVISIQVQQSPDEKSIIRRTDDYNLQIEGPILASGEVDVEITSNLFPVCCKIVSYNGLLPQVGDQYNAKINQKPSGVYAIPDYSFEIGISTDTDYRGYAIVEVTAVSQNKIVGKIVDKTKNSQNLQDRSESPFSDGIGNKNDLIG